MKKRLLVSVLALIFILTNMALMVVVYASQPESLAEKLHDTAKSELPEIAAGTDPCVYNDLTRPVLRWEVYAINGRIPASVKRSIVKINIIFEKNDSAANKPNATRGLTFFIRC